MSRSLYIERAGVMLHAWHGTTTGLALGVAGRYLVFIKRWGGKEAKP